MPSSPYRGPGPNRPTDVPLPPAHMPLLRGGRLLKRWRYVGAYGPERSLCVAAVRIGPLRQSFWAVWDRAAGRLHQRTRIGGAGGVRMGPGSVSVVDSGVAIELEFEEDAGIEVVTPYGSGYAWTRKQGGVPIRGRVELDGEARELDCLGIVDDSAGYPPRHTTWRWSAGVGEATDGRAVAWNLVTGIHDSAERSERTVWVDGAPHEVGPVEFADDLSSIAFAEGGTLSFVAEAVRARRDNLLIFRSEYEQPFGTFAGALPGGIEFAAGYGVMERHAAVW